MSQLLLVAYAVLVIGTPLIVVRIVAAAAARATAPLAAERGPTHWQRRLWIATVASWVTFAIWLGLDAQMAVQGPPRALLGVAELVAFLALGLAFGLPALDEVGRAASDIARMSRAGAAEKIRQASLRARRVSDYLPLPLQIVPFGIAGAALLLLAARIALPAAGDRRLILPVAFGVIAVVFAGLFAAWIREEACGASASGFDDAGAGSLRESERSRTIRRIFSDQVGLVVAFSVLALILVEVDWASRAGAMLGVGAGLVGGLVGVVGCAQALASDLTRRRLEAGAREILH